MGRSHGRGGSPPTMKISDVAVGTATPEPGRLTEFGCWGRFLPHRRISNMEVIFETRISGRAAGGLVEILSQLGC